MSTIAKSRNTEVSRTQGSRARKKAARKDAEGLGAEKKGHGSNRTYKPWSLSTETTRRPFDVDILFDIPPILAM
jgi:hypothetical protein